VGFFHQGAHYIGLYLELSHYVTHKWGESDVEEEDCATLQAYIRTLKQEVASMRYSSPFEVATVCDYPPREERRLLLPKVIKD